MVESHKRDCITNASRENFMNKLRFAGIAALIIAASAVNLPLASAAPDQLGGSAFPLTYATSPVNNMTDAFNQMLQVINAQCVTSVANNSTSISNIATFTPVASAVNQFIFTDSATGGLNSLASGGTGSDGTAPILIAGNTTGKVYLGNTTIANSAFEVDPVTSGVNHFITTESATGNLTTMKVGGTGADSTAPALFAANGVGTTYVGGSTAANAPFSAVPGSTNVNQVIATGTNTSGLTSLTVGGSGADATAPLLVGGNTTGIVYVGNTTAANAAVKVVSTASNVNQVVITGQATGTMPSIAAGGSSGDAGAVLNLTPGIQINGSEVPLPPGGRLTPSSTLPVPTADSANFATVYYLPYNGNNVPILGANGHWTEMAIGASGVSFTMGATNMPTTQVYDVYATNVSGTLTLCSM
jgi:hypothetical protein